MERLRHEVGVTPAGRKRRKKYGLRESDYAFMLEFQKNSCGICQTHQSALSRSLVVDHCHQTGRIRGLLCSNCNTALGLLKDSRQSIARAWRWVMTDQDLEAENGKAN